MCYMFEISYPKSLKINLCRIFQQFVVEEVMLTIGIIILPHIQISKKALNQWLPCVICLRYEKYFRIFQYSVVEELMLPIGIIILPHRNDSMASQVFMYFWNTGSFLQTNSRVFDQAFYGAFLDSSHITVSYLQNFIKEDHF